MTKIEKLLSSDPNHIYSEHELDAIEALDAALALRIARSQFLAEKARETADLRETTNVEIDVSVLASAIDDARKILSQDGGDIEFVGVEGREVRVRMKGACAGCPNSALDLRNVVERVVRAKVPGVLRVVNVF